MVSNDRAQQSHGDCVSQSGPERRRGWPSGGDAAGRQRNPAVLLFGRGERRQKCLFREEETRVPQIALFEVVMISSSVHHYKEESGHGLLRLKNPQVEMVVSVDALSESKCSS